MDSITLKRAVSLVVIVTDDFREQLQGEISAAIAEVDQNLQQLETQSRRYLFELQRTNLQQAAALRQRIDEEKQRQNAVKSELERQLQEATALENGAEFRRGALEGSVDVRVGDNLPQVLNAAEIVIQDGVVQALRYGSPQPLPAIEEMLEEEPGLELAGAE